MKNETDDQNNQKLSKILRRDCRKKDKKNKEKK